MISEIFGTILKSSMYVLFFFLIVALVGLLIWKWKDYKRYGGYEVWIFEEDAYGQKRIFFDKAGIFVKRNTNAKKFFLKNRKIGLEIDGLKYSSSNKGNKKIVIISKSSDGNYKYVTPQFEEDGDVNFYMTEEDLNWGLNAFDETIKTYDFRDKLLQYAPWLGLIFIGFLFLIIVFMVLKKFDMLPQVADSMKEAAASLAQGQMGTQVIS